MDFVRNDTSNTFFLQPVRTSRGAVKPFVKAAKVALFNLVFLLIKFFAAVFFSKFLELAISFFLQSLLNVDWQRARQSKGNEKCGVFGMNVRQIAAVRNRFFLEHFSFLNKSVAQHSCCAKEYCACRRSIDS